MYVTLLFCLLQFVLIYSDEKHCGCSVSRTNKQDGFVSVPKSDDQCPLNVREDNLKIFSDNDNMVLIPSGEYQLGTDDVVIPGDQEGPKKLVKVASFYIDKYEVSNRNFNAFSELTNYKTEAENFGDSFVFGLFLNSTFKDKLVDFRVAQATWWYKVDGANWKHPYGPDSDISDVMDHPAVHISWNDAKAYCEWRGSRLPTEVEWEAACRGGHKDTTYPWGYKLFPNKTYKANIWQGSFPNYNSAKDGFIGTNPVNMFEQNDFGLYNMAGNVWEWTEDDWNKTNNNEKVKKGGSYLCHHSYCFRYRCSSRSHNTADSTAGNLGFRCAKSVLGLK